MTFEFVKLPELDYDLEASTTEKGRVYTTPKGKKYRSITTVLSAFSKQGIIAWRKRVGESEADKISSKAATRGTNLHLVCEKYLLNEYTPSKLKTLMPNIKALFQQLKPELDKNIGKIYALEQALYSDELEIAGRVDCIAEWDGELAIIDFKTSGKLKEERYILNYFMQCTAYALMFEERTGRPIDKIVVVIAVENEQSQIFVRSKLDYVSELMKCVNP